MIDLVFGYGTLRPESHPISSFTHVGRAVITANLWTMRAKRGMSYNSTTWAGVEHGSGEVFGDVFEMPDEAAGLRQLDRREGCTYGEPESSVYHREVVTATMATGKAVEAWAYFMTENVVPLERVESGDWFDHPSGLVWLKDV